MRFLYTLQIIPLSNNAIFHCVYIFNVLVLHFWHSIAVITSAVEVQFTVFLLYFLLYFDYIYLQCICEKVLLLKGFIHCKHSKTTTFCRVLISIAHLAFNECYNYSGCTVYSVLLHLNCIFTVFICSVLLLLGGFCSIIHCSNFFQSFWQFFFPISNKIYRRFLLFADLGGMAPAVRRNEIKSACPHKHA